MYKFRIVSPLSSLVPPIRFMDSRRTAVRSNTPPKSIKEKEKQAALKELEYFHKYAEGYDVSRPKLSEKSEASKGSEKPIKIKNKLINF